MGVHYLISGLLLLVAALIYLRPQSISTLRHYPKERLAKVDLRRVRRTGSLGMLALALLIGPGACLLHCTGVDETTLTVLGWIVLPVGTIAIAARIETYDKNRRGAGRRPSSCSGSLSAVPHSDADRGRRIRIAEIRRQKPQKTQVMTIRPERPEEFPAIHRLVEEAFRTAKVSDGKEQDFTDRLRAAGGYIPSLALVAEEEGRLIGHTMLTRTTLRDGTPVLLLAPLSVVLDCRSRGIGAALVREALRRAYGREEQAVVLVGDPAYYGRFGFRRSTELGIRNTNGIPDEYVQVLELVPGALAGTHTTIAFEEP